MGLYSGHVEMKVWELKLSANGSNLSKTLKLRVWGCTSRPISMEAFRQLAMVRPWKGPRQMRHMMRSVYQVQTDVRGLQILHYQVVWHLHGLLSH